MGSSGSRDSVRVHEGIDTQMGTAACHHQTNIFILQNLICKVQHAAQGQNNAGTRLAGTAPGGRSVRRALVDRF